MLRFEPVSGASEHCCLTHWAIRNIKISDKNQWNHKIYGTTENRTRTYCLRNFCPNRTAEILFYYKKSWQSYTEKKEKRPRLMNNFSHIFKFMWRKILITNDLGDAPGIKRNLNFHASSFSLFEFSSFG